jgi:DHA1 family bicyclomycin/chloramphenicol resistance-like MFS transporter
MNAATSPPRVITLILLMAGSMLSLNMFLPSLIHMAEEFDVSYAMINLTVSGYLAVTAVLQIIFGPLSDRYGRRPVLLASAAVFIVASVGCVLATNFWVFLCLRIFQGAIIAGSALSRAVIRDMMSPQEAVGVLGTTAMAMAIAPMLGPIMGGFLDQAFGWRATFYLYVIMGAALFTLIWADLGETNKNPSDTFRQQFATYPELLKSRLFWSYAICLSFSIACFFAFLSGAPMIVQTVLGLPATHLGFYMGSITAGFVFGSFLSGRLIKRVGMTSMILIGRIVAVTGLSVGLIAVLSGFVSAYTIFGATVFIGIGNGLTLPSCSVGVMNVRSDLAGSASGLSGAMAVGFGAILATIMAAILTPENAAYGFLAFLLGTKLVSLFAAICIPILESRHSVIES